MSDTSYPLCGFYYNYYHNNGRNDRMQDVHISQNRRHFAISVRLKFVQISEIFDRGICHVK